ncbi:proliferation-associated protein 2G4 [Eurytemora carolleeae]|uniref:proliferation-associated protein 2G4 n=1 Tax=Eurytemora carolleeae TaxID=1294199 RepID=UPI000C75C6BF|nr:proliferation-associated protein 2G4 [Eurytemora carolleeae]|eukprot:XP_023344674.1 proliferation-associated protein 2G4-like [Eurytemora affinis]
MGETGEKNDLPTIADDLVVTKYKMSADIVNKVLKEVVELCKPEASVRDLCILSDKKLSEETSKAFKKDKKVVKGISFPTCISVNNVICHYSPLNSEPDTIMADGDVVKIDLGAHIDGFIAVVAHTLVIGENKANPVTGRKADAMMAAHLASEAALRLVKPGNETYEVTDTVSKIAGAFKCKPVEGMLSHQLEQNRIDGEKTIIQNPSEAQRKEHEKFEFELHEVYGVDVLISTGEGVGREKDAKITIYKKTEDTYMLKLKTSREFFSKISKQSGSMPFNLRNMEDERKARMGVVECVTHKLVEPFQVLFEKEGESVAQFKFTVLLMPNGPQKITGLPFDTELYKSEYTIEDQEIQKLLNTSANPKAAKKKKKAAEKAVSEETAAPMLVES